MPTLRSAARATLLAVTLIAAGSCSDDPQSPFTGPAFSSGQQQRDIHAAIAAQRRHTPALLRMPGVVGTAVGLLPSGRAAIRVFLAHPDVRGLPAWLDDVPVAPEVTGEFRALSDPTTRQRPVPLGFSVGHPAITAGTIGARVVDATGKVYILSNNHVLANSNGAVVGDATYQPGPFDGGTAADQIGTLAAFQPIDFSLNGHNVIDAAIALVAPGDLDKSTPADDGYGAPDPAIFGDADGDGVFDDVAVLLGVAVQKYGRTTHLTHGSITGISATIEVCYEAFLFICIQSAYFYDQLVVEPGTFSGGGDSGSLLVTDDLHPVALLFAGSETQTIANRIDLVLSHFAVAIDGGPPPPPPAPLTDVAISAVSAPAFVAQGGSANVSVTVRNAGNQDVAQTFSVTLSDATDGVTIGTQSVAGLAVGAAATLTFPWSTAASSLGAHTLAATHDFADGNATNDQRSTTSTVTTPGPVGPLHIGDLDGWNSDDGTTWSATAEITVHDANHAVVDGATVTGKWSRQGLNANTCTTGELGGTGTCIVLFPALKRSVRSVTYSVTGVTRAGVSYDGTRNHDTDGGTNGTSVRVNRP